MERSIYELIWKNSIEPKINRMLSSDDDIIFNEAQFKEKIWLTYEENKNKVHTYMYNPDGLIDRHKVASVMLYSIITNKPFDVKLPAKREVNNKAYLANEMLGFHTALAIVWSYIIEDAKSKSDNYRLEIFSKPFVLPKCQHESYEATIFKMLYYSKYNNFYDIFAFANILFLIEAYTELSRKNEVIGKMENR